MVKTLCVSVRFTQPYFHGRGDGGEPEWPPSPLRLFQALTATATPGLQEYHDEERVAQALRWLESQEPPTIVTLPGINGGSKYRLYVPDNTGDLAAGTWSRGDTTKAIRRTEKDVCPVQLPSEAVHYVFS